MTTPTPDRQSSVAPRPDGAVPQDLSGLSFEELLSTLEDLTGRMASGDIGIEAATDLYEQASRLHAEATTRLAKVQSRIDGLVPDQ